MSRHSAIESLTYPQSFPLPSLSFAPSLAFAISFHKGVCVPSFPNPLVGTIILPLSFPSHPCSPGTGYSHEHVSAFHHHCTLPKLYRRQINIHGSSVVLNVVPSMNPPSCMRLCFNFACYSAICGFCYSVGLLSTILSAVNLYVLATLTLFIDLPFYALHFPSREILLACFCSISGERDSSSTHTSLPHPYQCFP
jgi:hypothetical protein